MEIHRNKHFKEYLENLYVRMAQRHLSLDEGAARARFIDEYDNDVNMLNFVLNSTYPNTKRVDNLYHFITKPEFMHRNIATGKEYPSGAMTFFIDDSLKERVFFENPKFQHGQIRDEKNYGKLEAGMVVCWGGFKHRSIGEMFCGIGLSGVLMDMYNFARVSDHNTRMVEA